jgi:hypothetical protein
MENARCVTSASLRVLSSEYFAKLVSMPTVYLQHSLSGVSEFSTALLLGHCAVHRYSVFLARWLQQCTDIVCYLRGGYSSAQIFCVTCEVVTAVHRHSVLLAR